MSGYRASACADPGPGDAHCTEPVYHNYSCYDAGEDISWNEGQFRDGWYDRSPHKCDDPQCPGRPARE